MDLREMATAERRDLLDLLRTLEPADWTRPSLCDGWSVRQVVAHLISFEGLTWPQLGRALLAGRLDVDRINEQVMAPVVRRPNAELVDLVAAHLRPEGVTAALGGGLALVDGVIHQQDIRRPLGRVREIPGDRVIATLGFVLRSPVLPGRRLARGLHLDATDLAWSYGSGPWVGGTGEALLMTLAGRRSAVAELTGPGVAVLRRRLPG